jgi:glycosyltransferase involved in cell wall biosynthesis
MGLWQRAQLKSLGKSSDLIWFSIDPWKIKYQPWFSNKTVKHLPVGSNIPHLMMSKDDARQKIDIDKNTVVLGMFGQAHMTRQLDWIRDSAIALKGAGITSAETMQRELQGCKLICTGRLSADDVSRTLPAIDIFLSPFIDGVSTRRSSMMAALMHGLSVVGTAGINTDKMLVDVNGESILISSATDKQGFIENVLRLAKDSDTRKEIGMSAGIFYQDNFVWERMAKRMLDDMHEINEKRSD